MKQYGVSKGRRSRTKSDYVSGYLHNGEGLYYSQLLVKVHVRVLNIVIAIIVIDMRRCKTTLVRSRLN